MDAGSRREHDSCIAGVDGEGPEAAPLIKIPEAWFQLTHLRKYHALNDGGVVHQLDA